MVHAFYRSGALAVLLVTLVLQACGEAPAPVPHGGAAAATDQTPPSEAASDESGPSAASTDVEPRTAEAAVAALDAYRQAAAAGEGARAVEFLHPSYFEMTARQIDAALDADASTVASMDTMDRLMVYALRFRLEPEELRTLTPRAMGALAIDRGWIDDEVTGLATVAGVRLMPEGSTQPERALVSLEYEGTPVDAPIPVTYHEGRWLVDLAAMMADAGASIERMADQFGMSIDQFIERALMATEGRPLPENIDEPIGRE